MLAYANAEYYYTANGELQKKIDGSDTISYTYDYFGNLISVSMPNGDKIDYIIDAQNRRIGKKLNGAIVKRWIYSGQLSPAAELDSAGNVVTQFVGSFMIKSGITYQFITDHLGSIRLVVNVETGIVAQKIDYDEYGNVLYNTNLDFQPFGYAGGLYDTQTKLVRFGARDYDASIGRWTSKDPIGFGGGDANLYGYVLSNPINWSDPQGKILPWIATGLIGAAVGATQAILRGGFTSENTGNIIKSAAIGFVFGATGGMGTGIASVAAGSLGAAAGNAASQYFVEGKNINNLDRTSVLISAIVGGVFAGTAVDAPLYGLTPAQAAGTVAFWASQFDAAIQWWRNEFNKLPCH